MRQLGLSLFLGIACTVAAAQSGSLQAQQGDAAELSRRGMAELGFIDVPGVRIDPKQGAIDIRRAAAAGDTEASAVLGIMSRRGAGPFPRDAQLALRHLSLAAAAGHAGAQENLADMKLHGEGAAKDPKEAARLYALAAGQGRDQAKTALANLYELGLGVPSNGAKALALYREAAVAGYIPAQYETGRLLAQGKVVPKDAVVAYAWLNVAASYGPAEERTLHATTVQKAITLRRLVGDPKLLTLAQRQEAERLSANWSPGRDLQHSHAATIALDAAHAQSKQVLSRSELDSVMTNMVKEFNDKMAGTRVDDQTVIRMMTYDRPVPTLTYLYATEHYATTGRKSVEPEHVRVLRDYHIEKTCSSRFHPLMRAFGLEVTHAFEDGTTGRRLLDITVRAADCTR